MQAGQNGATCCARACGLKGVVRMGCEQLGANLRGRELQAETCCTCTVPPACLRPAFVFTAVQSVDGGDVRPLYGCLGCTAAWVEEAPLWSAARVAERSWPERCGRRRCRG